MEDKGKFNLDQKKLQFTLQSRPLSDREFRIISEMIYDLCRINLHLGKKELVQARLNKRLRKLGLDSYKEYLKYVEDDESGQELTNMVDILSTNLTYFFRESDHFDYIKDNILKNIDPSRDRKFRIWSAGCSSGEEAYTLAMVLREAVSAIDRMDALILATDISTRMLAVAREGIYSDVRFKDTAVSLKNKYFQLIESDEDGKVYKAKNEILKLIRFKYLNLMNEWPMQGKFNIVFCRNVMIYFDKKTQGELVNRFYEKIQPGGVFIVGHSESLTGITHKFRYVRPTIYIRD